MSTPQAQDQSAAKNFYDRISGAYDALADSGEHAAREEGLRLLAVNDGESVLEVGYGTGHSLVTLAQCVGPEGQVTGVDISEGMRTKAAERIAHEGLTERVSLLVQPVPPIPLPDDSVDVVNFSFTLELFPLPVIPEVLAEVARVLKPGGRLGIVSMSVTPGGETDSTLEKAYKWMHQHFPHIVDCQPIDLHKHLADAGYEIIAEKLMEIWTMPVRAVVAQVDA